METKRILVPTDFSAASDRAIELAAQLTRRDAGAITVFHAYDVPEYGYWSVRPIDLETAKREAESAVQVAALGLRARGLRAEAQVVRGRASEAILEAIERTAPDLVVMGTHGRRGLAHALLGSVAETIVRSSAVPVITVPQWFFRDRADAGRRLAQKLEALRADLPSVLGVDMGGAPLAYEIARTLGGSMDVVLVDPAARPAERAKSFDAERPLAVVSDRTVIVVCDAARDVTRMEIALREARASGARRVVAAVPVLSPRVEETLAREADDVVAVERTAAPSDVASVYRESGAPSRREVAELLRAAAALPMGSPVAFADAAAQSHP